MRIKCNAPPDDRCGQTDFCCMDCPSEVSVPCRTSRVTKKIYHKTNCFYAQEIGEAREDILKNCEYAEEVL